MMTSTRLSLVFLTSLGLGACTTTDASDGETSGSSSSSDSGGGSGNAEGEADAEEDDGNDDATFLPEDEGGEDGPQGPQPNGSPCADGSQCTSEKCFVIPLVGMGVCSDCTADSDCEGETGGVASCSLSLQKQYAECGMGEAGSTCGSDEACSGDQKCAPILGGIINVCSECAENDDCGADQSCVTEIDQGGLSGTNVCADNGSLENGTNCPVGNNAVCSSGHCVTTSFMGFLEIGVCGECTENADCGSGTCVSPQNPLEGTMCEGDTDGM